MSKTFICGHDGGAPADVLLVLVELASCCESAALGTPADCTCWEPVFDLEQAEVDETSMPSTRDTMCQDCAYRPSSPERSGDDRYQHADEDELAGLVARGEPFWCHQGMRKPVAHRHPSGIIVAMSTDSYQPPIVMVDGAGVPFKADGTAAERCAGWDAARRYAGKVIAGMTDAMEEK